MDGLANPRWETVETPFGAPSDDLLTGELDGACSPRHNRFMADELADSELVILDKIKHSILIEGPGRVAPRVREFLLKHRD